MVKWLALLERKCLLVVGIFVYNDMGNIDMVIKGCCFFFYLEVENRLCFLIVY